MISFFATAVLTLAFTGSSAAPPPRPINPATMMTEHVTYSSKPQRTGVCPKGERWVAGYTKSDGKRVSGRCRR